MISVELKGNFQEVLGPLTDDLLTDIPMTVWEGAIDFLKKVMQDKVSTIKSRKRVKRQSKLAGMVGLWASTYEWRLRMAKAGTQVETHLGEYAPVLGGIKAGMRTGTLLSDIENFNEPFVILDSFPLARGSTLIFAIDASQYSRNYPEYFHLWIENVKGIEGGLMPTEGEMVHALDILQQSVLNTMSGKWGGRSG